MSTVTTRRPKKKKANNGAIVLADDRKREIEAQIAREVERYDFDRRAVELRRLNKSYVEIAEIMGEERGEPITVSMVRKRVLNRIRNTDAEHDVRMAEWDKLESQRGRIREQIVEYEAREPHLFIIEDYQRLLDQYLKYSDRIARLMGLDQGGNNGGAAAQKRQAEKDVAVAAAAAAKHIHFHGSVDNFEEWQRLQEMGLTELATDVDALMASDVPDPAVTGILDAAAGTTLQPYIDVEARDVDDDGEPVGPASSLDALRMMMQDGA